MGTSDLQTCTSCGGGHVEIRSRVLIGYCRCEQIELACPDCGARREAVFDEEDVQRYDRQHPQAA